ncbi:MAG: 5'-methylthioadenosine/S-adenosylhomocysteine nucleosidase [Oscillospiraceae bacterium]|nr:5'-methylthioadenosine/S-adenosylhomocysteine nucleosidase [Oscillospiraceae bacterium]
MKELKIAIIVADDVEYITVEKYAEAAGAERQDMYARRGHRYELLGSDKKIVVNTALCGIGMVNAAAATMYYAQHGCDIIISLGMSGGMTRVHRGDIVVGTKFIEHDFDLTGLGYKPAEKPLQDYIYECDKLLHDDYIAKHENVKNGVMVSGDSFVCKPEDRDFMVKTWDSVACDMETAAEAYVCSLCGIKFLAVRKISDGASDDAINEYSQMKTEDDNAWSDAVLEWIKTLFEKKEIWN